MSRIAALDIGDRWTGIAVSDPLKMIARPLETVETSELAARLENLITDENISEIVVGIPITLKGTQSEQTSKVLECFKSLSAQFDAIIWHTHDERLSSKRAARSVDRTKKTERLRSHSIAAADFLQTFLNRHF